MKIATLLNASVISFLMFNSATTLADSCNLELGEKQFQQCKACHSLNQASNPNLSGPSLKGVIGREVGSVTSFEYSPAMKEENFKWSAKNLGLFIKNPNKVIPWNGMPFMGIESETERNAVV